jgi:hypothetical protein
VPPHQFPPPFLRSGSPLDWQRNTNLPVLALRIERCVVVTPAVAAMQAPTLRPHPVSPTPTTAQQLECGHGGLGGLGGYHGSRPLRKLSDS